MSHRSRASGADPLANAFRKIISEQSYSWDAHERQHRLPEAALLCGKLTAHFSDLWHPKPHLRAEALAFFAGAEFEGFCGMLHLDVRWVRGLVQRALGHAEKQAGDASVRVATNGMQGGTVN